MLSNVAKTAARIGYGFKEVVRLFHRNSLSHNRHTDLHGFMRTDTNVIQELIMDHLERSPSVHPLDHVSSIMHHLIGKFCIPELKPDSLIWQYRNVTAEALLKKEILRDSNLPAQMVTIVGGAQDAIGAERDVLYDLGKRFALAGIVVVCGQTQGYIAPFLEGFKAEEGLSIGVLPLDQKAMSPEGKVLAKSDLIKLPIFSSYSGGVIYNMLMMSGRAIVGLGIREEDILPNRVLFMGSYYAAPTFVSVNSFVHDVAALVNKVPMENILSQVLRTIFHHPEIDPRYRGEVGIGISVLAGTEYNPGDPAKVDVISLSRMLAEQGTFTITGGGPGPMEDVAEGAQDKLAVAMNFFSSCLSANRAVHIPVVSNLKHERSDLMTCSAAATLCLGGAMSTGDETYSVFEAGQNMVVMTERFHPRTYGSMGNRIIWVDNMQEAVAKTLELARENSKLYI